jgi:peroxiredoxin
LQRFATLVEVDVVKGRHVEQPGAFEALSAEAMLASL